VTRGGTDDRPEAASAEGPGDETQTTQPAQTTLGALPAEQAFRQASRQLEEAGTFAYRGTSQATDVSPVRPGLWLGVELTVEGEVDLWSNRMREVAVLADGQTSETVTDGTTVWSKLAASREGLAGTPYQTVGGLAGDEPQRMGAALLPAWLDATVDRQEALPGGNGREYRATVPAEVIGQVETGRSAVEAQILLRLDATGDPVHIQVTTAPSGPPLHLAFDISRVGTPVAITAPGDPGD
jgi:hypothetical protein